MKKARGFTLVEIVIVVGIIGLLMMVLVPSVTSSFKTNTMKAARLQAERIAKSIRVGILSGDVKTATTSPTAYTSLVSTNTINATINYINYIGGIDTLYEIDATSKTNEDLIDPTSDAVSDALKTFKIKYNNSTKKIEIYNAAGSELYYTE